MLHEEASAKTLRAMRVVVFGLWAAKIGFDPILPLAHLPTSLVEPIGLLRILPAPLEHLLLEPGWFSVLKIAAALVAGAAAVGLGGPLVAVLACGLITLYQGVLHGFGGHINHEAIVLLYATYVLAGCAAIDAVAKHRGRPDIGLPGIPLAGILTILCWSYALVGLYRILHGGLEIWTSSSLTHWMVRNSYRAVDPAWGWGRMLLANPALAGVLNAGFPIVTVAEALAPLSLISRRFRIVFLSVVIPFHFLSWLFMELFFWKNLLLFALFLTISPVRRERLHRWGVV